MIKKIRNSIKALIIKENALLFGKMNEADTGETYYSLPGGGQQGGEIFTEALRRECREELGAEVEVGDLALVREYIGKNHNLAYKHSHLHHVEYMFKCRLISGPCPAKATQMDDNQDKNTPYVWLTLKEMQALNIYPKILRACFDDEMNLIAPKMYLGDVN